MFVYDITFYPKEMKLDFAKLGYDFESRMHDFLTLLSGNNQIIIEATNVVKVGERYIARVTTPFEDSLESKYDGKYVSLAREKVRALSKRQMKTVLVGEDYTFPGNFPMDGDADYYVLRIHYKLRDLSPIQAGDSEEHIPLYLLPELDDDTEWALKCWKNAYYVADDQFYHGVIGERSAHNMLSKADSKLNTRGRELCRKLETVLEKPVYYYLYRFYGKQSEVCPICGAPWKTSEESNYDFRCDICKLVANKGANEK